MSNSTILIHGNCNRKSTETRDEYQAIYRGFQILHTSEKSEHSCFDPRTLKALRQTVNVE